MITRKNREYINDHNSFVLWFTGLSGSGKTTLANAIEEHLHPLLFRTYIVDGDIVRQGLCNDLGFASNDRTENIRRIIEVSNILVNSGVICIVSCISPLQSHRSMARDMLRDDFVEVYCNCSITTCSQRDVKGLYKQANNGDIVNFTGITSPYEIPTTPDIIVDTETQSVEDGVYHIINSLILMRKL